MYYFNKCILWGLLWLINYVESARILFHFPTPTHSHHIGIHPIIKELLRRGHDVVSITTHPIEDANKYPNLKVIDVNFTIGHWKNIFDGGALQMSLMDACYTYEKIMPEMADKQLDHPEVSALIRNESEHFDMVVMEYVKYHFLAGWAYRFKCPLFGLLTLDGFYNEHDAVGNPSHPYLHSSVIYDFLLPFANFQQRLKTIFYAIMFRYIVYTSGRARQNEFLRKHFGEDAPDVYELSSNVSMVFSSQSEIFNPRPKVPAWKYMSMMHIKEERKPLNKKLRDFFDNSPEGVVYFSLGSNVKSNRLPPEWIQGVIKAFSKLPYKVLWKWEQKTLPNQPSNLETCQWCPQQDILAEKNLKLFVTQGGFQSMEEAVYYKIPVLGIPIIIDQAHNILQLQVRGCGELLKFNDVNEKNLYNMIMKVASDSSYKKNIIELSNRMLDKPVKDLDNVVWWMEYVIRHKGASHLKAHKLPWYLHFMLDLVAFLILVISVTIYVFYKAYKIISEIQFLKHKKEKAS